MPWPCSDIDSVDEGMYTVYFWRSTWKRY